MVFDRIWNGTTDMFDSAVSTIVDLNDSPAAGAGGGLIGGVIDAGLRMPESWATGIYSYIQEDILGAPNAAQMAAQEPGDGLLPTIAKYATAGYYAAFDEGERNVISTIVTPALDAWQWTIDELVDRPLGTVATIVHDAQLNGPRRYFDVSSWQRAYNINDTERTFGQSFAYAFMGVDPYDEDEYNAIQSDPLFNLFSGSVDLVQELIDPVTYATGGAGKVARGATVIRVPGTSAVIGRTGAATAAIPGLTRIPAPVTRVIGTGFGQRGARNYTEAVQNVAQSRARSFAGTNYTNDGGLLPHRSYQQVEDAVSQLDKWQDRATAFQAILGRAARNMDERAIEMFARAETPQARQLTMRVLAGDFGAIDELEKISAEMLDIQHIFHSVDEFVEAQKALAAGDLDGVIRAAPESNALYGGDLVADLQRYNELQGYANWFQMYDMQQALYRTQQRSLKVNPETGIYEVDPSVQITLSTMDKDLFFNALEDMLGNANEVSSFSTHLSLYGSVREMPFGGRLRTLRNMQNKILDTTGDEVTISTFVNTNNMFSGTPGPQGRVMRVFSERVPQTIANSSDPNFLEQVSRMLDQARRVRVVGSRKNRKDQTVWNSNNKAGTRLTDEAEVSAIATEFQRLVASKDFAAVDAFFDDVVDKFNKRLDEMVDGAEFDGIDPFSRSTLADDYVTAQKKHDEKNVVGGSEQRTRERAVSIQGDMNTQRAAADVVEDDFALVHEIAEDGSDILVAYRNSPSQVKTSRVVPRYDVVQRKIERMERYSARATKAVANNRTIRGVYRFNDMVHSAWRGTMLLTPKWPIRVGIDEQLRMMITMGSMITARRSIRGYHDLRRDLSTKGLKGMESTGDVTQIAKELYDILDIEPPRIGEAIDYHALFESASKREFNRAVARVRNRALLQRDNVARILGVTGLKGGLFGLAFGVDIAMGAGYFGYSLASRHRRITQQTRRAANLNYAGVLRQQARASLMRAAGDPAAIRAAQGKMTDAEFIEQLAREVPEARVAQNQFEAAETLMGRAGFPGLRLGGANLRNAFGDDPKFIEQWRGYVSASKARDGLIGGAHRASKRELEEFYSTDWKRWDIQNVKVNDATFAEKWSRMMDLYTGNPIANEFYEIVWNTADTPAVRAERLVDLMERNPKVWNDLFAPQQIANFNETELLNAAKYVINEYDNVLPPAYFPALRERAMTGKVEWPEVRAALDEIVESANTQLQVPYVGKADKNIEAVPTEVLSEITPGNDLGKTNIEDLANDLLENGFKDPVVLIYGKGDRTVVVGEGNHRIAAAQQAGIREIPTRVIRTEGNAGGTPVRGFDPVRDDYVPGEMRPSQVMDIPEIEFEQVTRQELIDQIRSGSGDELAPLYPHFGVSLGPDPSSHRNLEKAQNVRLLGRGFVDYVYDILGTMPTDNMARHPFFRANYELEAARRIELLPTDADGKVIVTQRQLNEIEEGSRKFALKETRTVLYDLAENLRISELLGNSVAFLNAYAEVFSRWAGFALRQPAETLGKYRLYDKAWEAEAFGLTEMEDPESGARYLVFSLNGEDPTVFDALPQGLRDQIIPPFLEDGDIRMSKDGLNTALQGTLPGTGPLVTVVVREALLGRNPELEEVVGFMFPFGHPDGNLFERSVIGNLPAYQKAAYNLLFEGAVDNDEIVGRMMKDIYTQAQLDGIGIDVGNPEEVIAWIDEANERARQFNIFRIYQGLLAPSSTTLLSPFYEFIEVARDLQREHGQREGTRRFLDEHGMDFFALTQRMTRLNDGTAASLKSELLFEQNQEMVRAYPEIGAWITGSIGGAGEEYAFSTHVYWRQKITSMGDGTDANRRETLTPAEFAEQLSISRGWYEFFLVQDWERIERNKIYAVGLEGPGATFTFANGVTANPLQTISDFKQQEIRKLELQFPDWAAEYNNLGSSMMTRRKINAGFAAALQDETLSQRPSADHILDFYNTRMWVQNQLTARRMQGGSDNIETSGNKDLLEFWRRETELLGDRPGFSHVYDRFFERDRLLPGTFMNADDFGGLLEIASYR